MDSATADNETTRLNQTIEIDSPSAPIPGAAIISEHSAPFLFPPAPNSPPPARPKSALSRVIVPHANGRWGISPTDLLELFASRSLEAIASLGGPSGIAELLHSSLADGISASEIERRADRIATSVSSLHPPPLPLSSSPPAPGTRSSSDSADFLANAFPRATSVRRVV